jgi:hypothetical protein
MTSWFKPRGQSISGYEHCAAAARLSYQDALKHRRLNREAEMDWA